MGAAVEHMPGCGAALSGKIGRLGRRGGEDRRFFL